MKISKIRTYVLSSEIPKSEVFCFSQTWYDTRTAMIVEIVCDDRITGYGEASGPAHITAAIIDKVYAPLLIGRDPLERENLWLELYNRLRDHGRKGVAIEALSAIDIALWDIAGKYFSVPVCKLSGRCYLKEVETYATGLYRKKENCNSEELAEEAKQYILQGFRALKIKIGFGAKYDIEVVRAVREKVGSDTDLMVDANHAYDVATAQKLCRALEPFDIRWFEEPIIQEDLEGYRRLTVSSEIPIASGEAEFTRYGFRDIIANHAVDIIQPDCCVAGGLTEVLKIADLASTYNIRCIPHVWGSGVAIAASLHLIAMLEPCPPSLHPVKPMLELDRSPNVFREELVRSGINIDKGLAIVPTGPGLGIQIDQGVLEKYNIKKDS